MKKTILLFAILLFSSLTFSQTYVVVTSNMQGQLTSCENQVDYQVSIQNLSPFQLYDISLNLNIPTGVNYVVGSANNGVTETDLSNPNSLVLGLPIIPIGTTFNFKVSLSAGCMNLNTALSNNMNITFQGDNFTGGIISASQSHTSPLYNVLAPNLSMVSMTNQSINGSIGMVFQRCMTITNGGNGALSTFTLFHENGTGIDVLSTSFGALTQLPNGSLSTFGPADFSTIGNGNGLLDPGESFVICETIEIIQCANAQSLYSYGWGCNGAACQTSTNGANIVFDAETPNIQIARFIDFASVPDPYNPASTFDGLGDNCYGNNTTGDFESWIVVTNAGSGDAIATNIEIGQGWNGLTQFYYPDYYSSLNPASFTIEINGGGQFPLTLLTTSPAYAKACLPANPVGAVSFEIPVIAPGDTVIVRWNHFTCSSEYCENNTRRHLLHWRLRGSFQNNCEQEFPIPLTQLIPGTPGAYFYRNGFTLDNSPGTLLGNSSGQVRFLMENGEFSWLPFNSANDKYVYQVILPDNCLQVNIPTFQVRDYLNTLQPPPNSVVVNGDTVNFIYNIPLTGTQWTVSFDVSLDCATCATEGVKTIGIRTLFTPDTDCDIEMIMGCSSVNIEVFCPPVCEGINLMNTSIRRINLGLPDNDNNGIPDATGTPHDMSLLRSDRVMYGDTIEVNNAGYVQNTTALALNHIVLDQTITQAGNRMTYHYSKVRIVDATTGIGYTCNNLILAPTITTTGTTRNWLFDIPISSLNTCLPAGFSLQTADSVYVMSYFSNTANWGGNPILSVPVKNKLFSTTVPYTTALPANQLYGCNEFTKEFSLIGYYWTSWGPDTYVADNCGIFTISQNYYLSIGQCCENYNGGNLFPFEYRNWGNPDLLQIELPDDYEFIDAQFNFYRTAGTLASSASSWFPLVPSTIAGNMYDFSVGSYFGDQASGAPILYGDDGWAGTLSVRVRPNCAVADSSGYVIHRWFIDPVAQLLTSGESNTVVAAQDNVTYFAPTLSLQSSQLVINSQDGQSFWDLTIQNTSFISGASNFWIGAPTINNTLIADSLLDLSTSTLYLPNANGIFSLPDLPFDATRVYRLFTTASSCTTDSIIVHAGWDCTGYPNSVADYPCQTLQVKLVVNPLNPNLESVISVITPGLPDLCDTLEFEYSVRNFQLGYAYDLMSSMQLPNGLNYIAGSSQLIFQGNTLPLPDPALTGPQNYNWDLSATIINDNGLIGIINPDSNFYRIRFKALSVCGYNSGSRIFGSSAGDSYCGSNHVSNIAYSPQIFLNGLTVPYVTDINLGIDYIYPCGNNNNMDISIVNNGAANFGSNDSIIILLPVGLNYSANSFAPVHNAAVGQTEPSIQLIAGQQQLTWPLMANVAATDSMSFSISLSAIPDQLPCEILEIRGTTNALLSASCNGDPTLCDVGVITGEEIRNLFVYKTDFNLINPVANINLNAAGNELLSGSFDMTNIGASLSNVTPIVINLYNDVDLNGMFSGPDVLLSTEAINQNITAGSTYSYVFNNVLAPGACRIVAVVSIDDNPCLCSTKSIAFIPTVSGTNFYDTICSNEIVTIGNPANPAYTYTWANHPNISNLAIMQPTFSFDNTTSLPVTIALSRTIARANCPILDTSYITINPLPLAVISGATNVCQNATSPVVTFTGSNASAPYTFTYNINGGASQTVTSVGNVATVNAPTAIVGTFNYNLLSVVDGSGALCSQAQVGTVAIVVNPLPTAVISGTTTVCQNAASPIVTFTGSNATAPYTFTYNINGGASQTVVSTGDIATLSAPTATSGTFTYNLVSVVDASGTLCSQAQTGSAVITVNPLPTATISGTTSVCQNAVSPNVTFVGANATAPYTFTYNINGGAAQTVTSLVDFVTVPAPTNVAGTFTYNLESVVDASGTLCSQAQIGSAVITVNQLPTAAISGATSVCQNAVEPVVTFTGANTIAPYTFTYNIDGGASQTITSVGDIATVAVPTTTAGTFTYNLLSVVDASGTLCSQAQAGSVAVVVNPLPIAAISGATSVCQDAASPNVIFTGSNATAPYTFTYTINGGASQTVTSIGDIATVAVPTNSAGTFNYNLVSVVDASGTLCSQAQTGTVAMVVNPLPTAAISGTISVCQNATAPNVTFTAANATPPYTFTYNIDGAASQTVTSVGDIATIAAPTTITGVFTYNLESVVDASGTLCSQVQIGNAVITVNELPTAVISGATTVCQNAVNPDVTFTGANTISPYTFTYNINGGASQTVTSTGDIATVSVPTTASGTFTYNLLSVVDASGTLCSQVQTGSVDVVVNPLPIAVISGATSVCQNETSPNITFTGSNATAPYTFSYNIDGGATQTVTSFGDIATVVAPTNIVGTFTYNLLSIVDASGTLCSQVQVGTAVVVVNPLPTAVISGDATVCQNATAPTVTFTGSNATSPYTFSYNIDGGATQTVTSVGDIATVAAPTNVVGTFTYNLLSVVDASGTLCSQAQAGTAVIVVNPLPLAVISGSTSVCQDAVSPTVTFTGSNATAPYTFTYTINGGAAQTITSIGDIATIAVPTNLAGTYNYNLVSVVDASGTLCSNLQTGTAAMIVNPLPLANIYGTVEVCLNTTEDTYVTLVGSNGTAPYTFAYTINGGTIQTVTSSVNTATVLVPTNVVGTFDYNLIGVTDASSTVCSSVLDETISVTVRPLPTAQIIGGDSLCVNTGVAPIEFVGATGANPYTFSYSINGGSTQTISSSAGSDNVFMNAPSTTVGTFVYSLISVSESGLGCAQSQAGNVIIVIHPDPIPAFTPSPNVIMFSDNVSQMINSSVGATTYVWDFGDGKASTVVSPYHQFEIEEQESFTITLTAITEFGCIATSVEEITVREDELVYVPNTFTPNGNELNQVFKPVIYSGIEVSTYLFEIYNRWGELVYTSTDPALGWDGTYKGIMSQDGTYIWRMSYTTVLLTNRKTIEGHVNLLR